MFSVQYCTNQEVQMANPFKKEKESKGISINQIAEMTGINRRAVKAIVDDGQFDTAKFCDMIKIADVMKINLYRLIREQYGLTTGEIYEEQMDAITNRLVEIQMDLIYTELSEFAKLTKSRVDDFDVKHILSKKTNLHTLIALISQLKNKEITPNDALRILPPVKPFTRRQKK